MGIFWLSTGGAPRQAGSMEGRVSWNFNQMLDEGDGPLVAKWRHARLPGHVGGAIPVTGGCGVLRSSRESEGNNS